MRIVRDKLLHTNPNEIEAVKDIVPPFGSTGFNVGNLVRSLIPRATGLVK